uniref:3-oxoacyl-[acyl-carrier-protein] reductase n=2 Tax=Spongospora subterranea TaxID=70186 RepID=A0A0H5QRH9_9EUKA|eukprot:CRZ04645.1 hypothetical protein [Spongospora subterranea]
MSKLVIRSMIRCKTGSIVHLGSTVGCDGQAGQIAYSSAKAGLIGMTKSMAKEFGRKGIRVNMVAPGYINTDMTNDFSPALKKSIIDNTPLQRIGSSEDVASLVRFLLSDQASFITGQCIRVDGGLSMPLM